VGRKVDIDNLVGAAEIAERLGIKRPHLIHDWRRRHPEFPKPVIELKGTLIWEWPAVEVWARSTGRLPD
jgi:hypothetical protein